MLPDEDWAKMTVWILIKKLFPIALLISVVLGGIYGGIVTPVEAGAAGCASLH